MEGPLEEALAICRQIAEVLEGAHEKEIIHGDLKPANERVTPGAKVEDLDFGLAKVFQPYSDRVNVVARMPQKFGITHLRLSGTGPPLTGKLERGGLWAMARPGKLQSRLMSSSDLVCLLILPSVVWASLIFIFRPTSRTALKLRTAWNATTKQELVNASRLWTLHGFVTFSSVLVAMLLWARIQEPSALKQILNPRHYVHGLFDGVILGLVMTGLTVILRNHFPKAQKFSLPMMVGVASSPLNRTVMLLLIVFTEELWRAVCLKSLIGSGLTGPQALIATSIAYGLTYSAWGPSAAISECILGAVLGGLFIWTNSFFVAFAAHLILLGQILLLALAVAPDAGPGDSHLRPFRRCPSCKVMLTLQQVNLNPDEAFSCPHCHVSITISDWRGSIFRWGYSLYSIPLYIGSFDIVDKTTKYVPAQFFLAFALMLLSLIGFWSLLAGFSRWKLELESGDPHFIRMNLDEKHRGVQAKDGLDTPDQRNSK